MKEEFRNGREGEGRPVGTRPSWVWPYPDTEQLPGPPGPWSQGAGVEGGVGVSQECRLQHIPAGPVVLEAALVHVHLWPRCLEVQGHYKQDGAVTGWAGLRALEPASLGTLRSRVA